jgi:TPR repeat protein
MGNPVIMSLLDKKILNNYAPKDIYPVNLQNKSLAKSFIDKGRSHYHEAINSNKIVKNVLTNLTIYYLENAAINGSVSAATYLASTYLEKTSHYNQKLGGLWTKYAAEQNAPLAQLHYGRLLQHGIGSFKKNPIEALVWFERASKYIPESFYEIGLIYLKNEDKFSNSLYHAYTNFIKAASKDTPEACFEVAKFLIEGILVKKDVNRGLWFLRKAIEKKIPGASEYHDLYIQYEHSPISSPLKRKRI